ncbi:hypothetical protein K461DRAFT_219778 [Myriangium duriaei CBS 260.36]|uniref:Zn(2)-C6 fungal-type domain-containing protein n=1 Tax=Myriangium duriaei CBS 260.36 TaxID=1168546 RepID=A0A9P4J8B8_9PEZI|nr:hypothetical protein K461DRAFT_219778 [Myriangium duriaei CBS 260.36]
MEFTLSPTSPGDSPESSSRRDRAAIAAQACQTCRNRKSKCDERRPKCGLCTRLNVNCVYREPQPTKKDKTLVHILQVLERVESKVDRMSHSPSVPSPNKDSTASSISRDLREDRSTGATSMTWDRIEADVRQEERKTSESYLPVDSNNFASHMTASHRVLLWPTLYLMVTNAQVPVSADLNTILQEGSPWFTRLELQFHPNPLPGPPSHPTASDAFPAQAAGLAGLTTDAIRHLADAYFDTFNVMHPILDRELFYSEVIAPVIRGGVANADVTTCLALTVLALGQVAIEGVTGTPLTSSTSGKSGIRGGTTAEPPGLPLFNEARRKFINVMNSCSLENVQIYLLQATYYEACARHMDFWRSCAAASMAFQVYIRCERIDWATPRADMIKRVYWTCILNEDLYHLELDLPRTGIYGLEDQIPLPAFQRAQYISSSNAETSSYFHYHFLAMIALRRLIARIHSALHTDSDVKAETSQGYDGPPIHLVKELARQLESWRTYLPHQLQWSDNDMHGCSGMNPLARTQPGPLFTTDDTGDMVVQRQNLDIVTAHLRTRFYYARYLIFRPFVFKALHFPEAMTGEDEAYCALALQSALMWPLVMYPCRNKKRLLPHLFTWTQNFVGILLILRMTLEHTCLRKIREERVNEADVHNTMRLLLDWIRDLKTIDGVADWSWKILEPLYAGFHY